MGPNLRALYGEYLEHSLRYYILDRPVVSDAYYDDLCKTLLVNWHGFEHRYKHLTDESALSAGSGFQLKAEDLEPILWMCRLYGNPLKEVFQ